MPGKNPFKGQGAGKSQPTGQSGGISGVHENTGPSPKAEKHTKSHPKTGGTTQGPSGDIGVGKWNP
jgi:hypothetical protein